MRRVWPSDRVRGRSGPLSLALLDERHLARMCQVLRGKLGVIDHCVDLRGERVEGALKRGRSGAKCGQRNGEAGAQEAIIGSREEEGDAEAEVGHPVAEAVWPRARSIRAGASDAVGR